MLPVGVCAVCAIPMFVYRDKDIDIHSRLESEACNGYHPGCSDNKESLNI